MRRFVAVQKRQRRDDLQYSSVYISTSASRKMDDGNVAKSSMAASTSNDETNAMTASTNGSLKRKRLRDSFAATIDDTATTEEPHREHTNDDSSSSNIRLQDQLDHLDDILYQRQLELLSQQKQQRIQRPEALCHPAVVLVALEEPVATAATDDPSSSLLFSGRSIVGRPPKA